jgi:hypothetical protein
MNTTYQTPANDSFAPKSTKGRIPAILRLFLCGILLVVTFIGLLPVAFNDDSLWNIFVNLLATIGSACMISAIVWIVIKSIGVVAPKAFGWANAMWRSWHALTVFGLVLKAYAWIIILFLPISVCTGAVSALCFAMAGLLTATGLNFIVALLMLVIFTGLLIVLVSLDLCKITGRNWKDEVKSRIPAIGKFMR